MIFPKEIRCVHIISRFPCVVAVWVTLPLDKVLEEALAPMSPVIDDCFDFELLFTSYQVRWRSGVIRSVSCGFSIGSKKGSVKDIVDLPGGREFQFERDWGNDPSDAERT